MKKLALLSFAALLAACSSADAPDADNATVSYEIEDLGGNFGWSEGPVWINQDGGYVLFTDVPGNTIHRYSDADGLSVWMSPSGADPVLPTSGSAGANGLFPYGEGRILVPDHGNRALYALDLATKTKTELASTYQGKRLNSPNDVVVHDNGTLFFTDPPYGLKGQDDSPVKELAVNGVYALKADGTLELVIDDLTRPNGIALSPDQRTLYVANSDENDSSLYIYDLSADGTVGEGRRALDETALFKSIGYGKMDGMAVATDGTIYATAAGGVVVLDPEGTVLSRIRTEKPVANVAFGGSDGRTLYMTQSDRLLRTRVPHTGLGF